MGAAPTAQSGRRTNIAGQAAGGKGKRREAARREAGKVGNAEQGPNATKTQQDNRRNESPSSKRKKKPRPTHHLNPSPPPPTLATPALSHILPHAAFPSQTLSSNSILQRTASRGRNIVHSSQHSSPLPLCPTGEGCYRGGNKKKGGERGMAATSLSLRKQVSERVRKIK